jgi:biopolymer transport protein ExbD
MNQAPRGSLSWLRFGAALPLFAGLLIAFGATARPASPAPQGPDQALVEHDKVIQIEISSGSEVVQVDGETVALKDLKPYLENLISTEGPVQCISIRGDKDAKMGILNDVKDVLRSIGQLKIQYTAPKGPAVERRMPPPVGVNGTVTVQEALQGVNINNVMAVRINSADRVLAGNSVANSDEDILVRAKDFIRERAPRGIITLWMDKGTSYSKYYEIQKLLKQAYDEVRDEEAQRRYGKALAELTRDELETVWMAVPLNISEAELTNRPQPRVR